MSSSFACVLKISNKTYFRTITNAIVDTENDAIVGHWNPDEVRGDRCIVISGNKYFKSIQNKIYSISQSIKINPVERLSLSHTHAVDRNFDPVDLEISQ